MEEIINPVLKPEESGENMKNMEEIVMPVVETSLALEDSTTTRTTATESQSQSTGIEQPSQSQTDISTLPITDTNLLNVVTENEDESFGAWSNSSSQLDIQSKSSPERTIINEMELKYLEDQANLKELLEGRCRQLQLALQQKDEVIMTQERDKGMLEKEKMMVQKVLIECFYSSLIHFYFYQYFS